MPKIKPIKIKSLKKKSAIDLKSLIKSKNKKKIKPIALPVVEEIPKVEEEYKPKVEEPKISEQT